MLDLKQHLSASRKDLERFGTLFFAVMSVVTALLFWRGSPAWPAALTASGIFLVLRVAMPPALRPFYVVWMTFGSALAWLNTRVLLGILFYLVMTPIGLFLRAARKDVLGLKIEPKATTYWVRRSGPERGRERYEQIF